VKAGVNFEYVALEREMISEMYLRGIDNEKKLNHRVRNVSSPVS